MLSVYYVPGPCSQIWGHSEHNIQKFLPMWRLRPQVGRDRLKRISKSVSSVSVLRRKIKRGGRGLRGGSPPGDRSLGGSLPSHASKRHFAAASCIRLPVRLPPTPRHEFSNLNYSSSSPTCTDEGKRVCPRGEGCLFLSPLLPSLPRCLSLIYYGAQSNAVMYTLSV